jgi:hypothetical protein
MKEPCQNGSKLSSLITDSSQVIYHMLFIWLQLHQVTCFTHWSHSHMWSLNKVYISIPQRRNQSPPPLCFIKNYWATKEKCWSWLISSLRNWNIYLVYTRQLGCSTSKSGPLSQTQTTWREELIYDFIYVSFFSLQPRLVYDKYLRVNVVHQLPLLLIVNT